MSRPQSPLMKPDEVAVLFNVKVPTVVEWARTGKLPATRTPGGQHYRFRRSDVEALLSDDPAASPTA